MPSSARPSPFAPFRHRDFRTLWTATLISNFGALVQAVGAAWMMTQLTDSATLIALVQASNTLPIMIFALISGALADIFDRKTLLLAAQAFMAFLKTPIAHELWMAQTGFLTPFTSANAEMYGDPTLAKMGKILTDATTFRFDGSDLMPAGVGAGAFWTGMVDYVGGKSAQDVATQIQAAWPK